MDVEKIVREYIAKTPHLSLGTSHDNKPRVCEVNFIYDDALNLYFISGKDSSHAIEVAHNPAVAGSIVMQHDKAAPPRGIYFEGSAYQFVDPSPDQIQNYARQHGRDEKSLQAMLGSGEYTMYVIRVSVWFAFGDFGNGKTQKYSLEWGAVS